MYLVGLEEEQHHRQIEHFREVLNQPDPPSFLNFDSYEVIHPLEVSTDEIRITEVLKAIKTLKNNKPPGNDNITPELLKHGGPDMAQELCHLFNIVWNSETVPDEWRKGMIVGLPKKGDLSYCYTWRGITLLSVPGKVFCSILLNRLREEQAGFRSGRSCSEQILTLRNIIEQSCEFNQKVFINFMILRKHLTAFIENQCGK